MATVDPQDQPPSHVKPLLDHSVEELADLMDGPAYRVGQLQDWLYRKGVDSVDDMTNLSKALREKLGAHPIDGLMPLSEQTSAAADTVKWAYRATSSAGSAAQLEAVLMRYPDRATVCISTQAGCAQACPFCATGQGGFQRHLSTGEMVGQVLRAKRWLGREYPDERLSNVVFMGMGEPLANYDATLGAIVAINSEIGISARSLTISTIGIPGRMRQLAKEAPPVTLALSLHAPDDALRDRLVPPNKRWPIREVLAAADDFTAERGRRVTIEYTLMDGINDSVEQAHRLADVLGKRRTHVNCIPMNPTNDPTFRPSSPETVRRFVAALRQRGVNATLRQNRGTDIDAACGQLSAKLR